MKALLKSSNLKSMVEQASEVDDAAGIEDDDEHEYDDEDDEFEYDDLDSENIYEDTASITEEAGDYVPDERAGSAVAGGAEGSSGEQSDGPQEEQQDETSTSTFESITEQVYMKFFEWKRTVKRVRLSFMNANFSHAVAAIFGARRTAPLRAQIGRLTLFCVRVAILLFGTIMIIGIDIQAQRAPLNN